ncbi:MAG: hypothetical protein QM845_02715 [Verrucomicrobiota bacterium]|nr:hypothetical protein [Verrucomicrobiota bacterium]
MSRWKTGIVCAVVFMAALGIIGAAGNPGWFPSLHVGGGYGNTGVTVTDAGNVSANGTLTVDGVATINNRMVVSRGGSVFVGGTTTGQNQTGSDQRNVGIGELVLPDLTTGHNNVAIGRAAGFRVTTGNENMAVGAGSFGFATSNSRLTGAGFSSGGNVTTGSDIVAIGYSAGRYRGAGTDAHTSANQGTYIGAYSRSEASGGTTNEIVIGYNAVGAGSNTATLGNTSLTGVYTSADLFLRGGDAHFGVTGTTRGVSNHYRGTSTNTPGATMLEALDGTDYYVWMGADGRLRRHTSLPTADTDGVPVAYAHPGVQSVTKNQTTPSVAGVNMVVIPGDWTAGNNITNFTGGQPGQHLVIQGGSSNCVVVDNANLWLAGNWTAANEASLTLMYNGSNWVELSRSAN